MNIQEEQLYERVMERIDLTREMEDEELSEIIYSVLQEFSEEEYLPLKEQIRLSRRLFHSFRKLDVLQELVEDDSITEIMINGKDHIFVERDGRIVRSDKTFLSQEKLEDVIQQIVSGTNRYVNELSPIVDARLEDGSRVNVVLKPVALNGPIMTIRKFPKEKVTMKQLVEWQSITEEAVEFLKMLVKAKYNIFVSGGTGAGKTTLVNLILRFYDVNGGSITIDGVDVRDMKREALRSMIGMVLQDTWLFAGTIKENIRYGRLDATDQEVTDAARAAHANGFIMSMPGGYDMELHEGASNIAQGQRQLLTIARAFLSDPEILILDEATSSVDTRTEVAIQKAMNKLMEGRTSFVIAHRLSTIKDAELIVYMEHGDIKEVGNHRELLAKGGYYAALYNSQFAAENAG